MRSSDSKEQPGEGRAGGAPRARGPRLPTLPAPPLKNPGLGCNTGSLGRLTLHHLNPPCQKCTIFQEIFICVPLNPGHLVGMQIVVHKTEGAIVCPWTEHARKM